MKYALFYTDSRIHCPMISNWGKRLYKAMGEDILPRDVQIGGEFRPPTYRSMAEALSRNTWEACSECGPSFRVVPYNDLYDGWNNGERRAGFMATAINSYEYAYKYWDKGLLTSKYYPNLLDNATFACWAELLPEPYSLILEGNTATLSWAKDEPRVHRYQEMGRYSLNKYERIVEVTESSWRIARAEAYVQAWEKMISKEPEDKYKSVIEAEQKVLAIKWNRSI